METYIRSRTKLPSASCTNTELSHRESFQLDGHRFVFAARDPQHRINEIGAFRLVGPLPQHLERDHHRRQLRPQQHSDRLERERDTRMAETLAHDLGVNGAHVRVVSVAVGV